MFEHLSVSQCEGHSFEGLRIEGVTWEVFSASLFHGQNWLTRFFQYHTCSAKISSFQHVKAACQQASHYTVQNSIQKTLIWNIYHQESCLSYGGAVNDLSVNWRRTLGSKILNMNGPLLQQYSAIPSGGQTSRLKTGPFAEKE